MHTYIHIYIYMGCMYMTKFMKQRGHELQKEQGCVDQIVWMEGMKGRMT